MTTSEIFEIIKSHKRFSKFFYDSNFEYIDCNIVNNPYKIIIEDKSYDLIFICDLYKIGFSDIKVILSKQNCTEKNILFKFSEIVRLLKKAEFFLTQRQKHISKIKPKILDFIKNEYSLELNESQDYFKFDFPQTCYRVRKKLKTEYFNLKREKKANEIKYKIYVSISNDIFWSHSFYFDYYGDNKLILTLRNENYKVPIDLTRIIRSEKLKNLMFCEHE